MQINNDSISLKQWFSEHKNELEAGVLEVLNSKAAQHPLFPCCSGLSIRRRLGLDANFSQPLTELMKDMERRGLLISHNEKETGIFRWRLPQ